MQVVFAPTRITIKKTGCKHVGDHFIHTGNNWGQSLGVLMSYILLYWSDQYKHYIIYLHVNTLQFVNDFLSKVLFFKEHCHISVAAFRLHIVIIKTVSCCMKAQILIESD
jgi:hypothetical protein